MLNLKIIAFFVCWQITNNAYAQKLPAVQQVSLFAPYHKAGNLLAVLDNKFQAYNKNNRLYYTISNDDNNLYLSAYTTDKLTIQKIVRWGLALAVDRGKKIGRGSPSISFPIPDHDNNFMIIRTFGSEVASKASYNAKMAKICKFIAVNNLTGINDPTISVYNSDGIKALASFNDKLEYTYELTVPLKYLNIDVKDKIRFHYDIKLNGGDSDARPGAPAAPKPMDGRSNPNQDFLFSPTNFGGIYTLAAK